jgi:hypothetical protein
MKMEDKLMTFKSLKALIACIFSLSAVQTYAHHGWSWYSEEEFILTARVIEIDFGNPHDRMTLEAEGRQWKLLLSPPSRTRRSGLSADMIQLGDTITAYGHRDRNLENYEMKTERLQVGDTLFNLYPRRD